MKNTLMIVVALLLLSSLAQAGVSLTIQVDQPGARINPRMWGLFYEDINFAADGGLYAELVKNRSFEFDEPLRGWRVLSEEGAEGRTYAVHNESRPRNPRVLRIEIDQQGRGFGLHNEGFRGMGVKQGVPCHLSLEIRRVKGNVTGLRAELMGSDESVLAETGITGLTEQWQTLTAQLLPKQTDAKASLNIWFQGEGSIEIDMVSLFPSDTYKGRENGLRADLVQMLADLEPGFLRFPGGCIVEGFDLAQRYQWKNTVGDLNERVVGMNRWNNEFSSRATPDYFQSFGLGFYEYFLLAEDLGAEPMPIINCGMACQFNTGELVPVDGMGPYIQDALDLIEFANGPVTSKWGKLRADMGHPEPFNMKMLGVGNEQWGPQYIERYIPFAEAIKARYPEIELVAATGSDARFFPNGQAEIEYLWQQWRKLKPAWVDEHYYRDPNWFLDNADYYDDFSRKDPPVLVSEYAAHSNNRVAGRRKNDWGSALAEAAAMTGFERNADVVGMASYAPLFAHAEAWQWSPNLIWFDNLRVNGTANYYVQQAFSTNRGDVVLPTQLDGAPTAENERPRLYASAVLDQEAREVVVKLVNVTDQEQVVAMDLAGAKRRGKNIKVTVLHADDLADENTLDEPGRIVPQESTVSISAATFDYGVQPYSLTLLRIPVK